MLIKKIMCPTDLSKNTKGSTAYAISLAREHKAELIFFHVTRFPAWDLVYPAEPNPFFREVPLPRFTVDDLFKKVASKVGRFIQTNFNEEIDGLRWKTKIGLGKIPHEIAAAAAEEETDLIVMAKRKRNALVRALTRSISDTVSDKAPCPVLSLCPPQIIRLARPGRRAAFLGILKGVEA
jgi:nucleotide-binding universal stress UspA family protein